MSNHIRIYNPIANQTINKNKLNVIGRVVGLQVPHLSILLNNFLVRRIRPSRNGAFECRIDLGNLENGDHTVEIRSIHRGSTERVMVPFKKNASGMAMPPAEPDE